MTEVINNRLVIAIKEIYRDCQRIADWLCEGNLESDRHN